MKLEGTKINHREIEIALSGLARLDPIPETEKFSVPVPTEETLKKLNAIAKQIPFCYYYREKKEDVL